MANIVTSELVRSPLFSSFFSGYPSFWSGFIPRPILVRCPEIAVHRFPELRNIRKYLITVEHRVLLGRADYRTCYTQPHAHQVALDDCTKNRASGVSTDCVVQFIVLTADLIGDVCGNTERRAADNHGRHQLAIPANGERPV